MNVGKDGTLLPSAILFWDIDGTLLTTARAGISAWERAFEAVIGRTRALADYPTAGLTDVEIATLLAREGGDNAPETVARLLRVYEDRLPESLPSRIGKVMPGVREILERLQKMPRITSMLLTGNTKGGAIAKLTHYGLAQYFEGGAFSDGLPDRPSIAERAVKLVERRYGSIPREIMYVIGDTPQDIACGKAVGVRTIAVCTGGYDRTTLKKNEPWLLLDSLTNTELFFAVINKHARGLSQC